MATFAKNTLSGSANFNLLRVTSASSPGVIVHTGTSLTGENSADEVWIWACNTGTSQQENLTLEWGGAAACHITALGSQTGYTLIAPGLPINAGNIVRARSTNASQVSVMGFVNYIRP
mgnify:CR=1 FL=1